MTWGKPVKVQLHGVGHTELYRIGDSRPMPDWPFGMACRTPQENPFVKTAKTAALAIRPSLSFG